MNQLGFGLFGSFVQVNGRFLEELGYISPYISREMLSLFKPSQNNSYTHGYLAQMVMRIRKFFHELYGLSVT